MSAAPGVTLEPLQPDEAVVALLHAWVTHPRSTFWMMTEASPQDVREEYLRIAGHPHHDAWWGRVDGEPAFLAETYDPRATPEVGLADLPELRAGDLGMHLLVAPPSGPPRTGLTRQVFAAVMAHCFADPSVERVVVEPDVRNRSIARLNAEAGFEVARVVDLAGKSAALSFCTRSSWEAVR